jgi:hypothetical protein
MRKEGRSGAVAVSTEFLVACMLQSCGGVYLLLH